MVLSFCCYLNLNIHIFGGKYAKDSLWVASCKVWGFCKYHMLYVSCFHEEGCNAEMYVKSRICCTCTVSTIKNIRTFPKLSCLEILTIVVQNFQFFVCICWDFSITLKIFLDLIQNSLYVCNPCLPWIHRKIAIFPGICASNFAALSCKGMFRVGIKCYTKACDGSSP